MEFIITFEDDGKKLLNYLRGELGLSSKNITLLKKSPTGILKNGEHVTVRALLQEGDILTLELEDTDEDENEHLVPTELPFDIIYEDEDVIALNKPYAMPTHPTMGHYDDTLANGLACYYAKMGRPFVFRAVNRLDGDTSGIVLVAKNRVSAYRLSLSLQRGEVDKTYIALLEGSLTPPSGEIKGYIRRCGDSIITREVTNSPEGAKFAHTVYETISERDGISCVLCRPITGRTHQLRVHFSSVGAPIMGDDMYGGTHDRMGRQALHAVSLSFPHPRRCERITLIAGVPEDMKKMLPMDEAEIIKRIKNDDN